MRKRRIDNKREATGVRPSTLCPWCASGSPLLTLCSAPTLLCANPKPPPHLKPVVTPVVAVRSQRLDANSLHLQVLEICSLERQREEFRGQLHQSSDKTNAREARRTERGRQVHLSDLSICSPDGHVFLGNGLRRDIPTAASG